jgi:hypothetical protein
VEASNYPIVSEIDSAFIVHRQQLIVLY